MYYLLTIIGDPQEALGKQLETVVKKLCSSMRITDVYASYKNMLIISTVVTPKELTTEVSEVYPGLEFIISDLNFSNLNEMFGRVGGSGKKFVDEFKVIGEQLKQAQGISFII